MIITKVQDKNVLGRTINVIATNIMSYDLGQDDCRLRYELRYRNPNRESEAIVDSLISSGVWQVPTNVVNAWTGSNGYLAESLCKEFDFKFVEHLES
jgi:hypothetical protein